MSKFTDVAIWVYSQWLRLYPRHFRTTFAVEMQDVFTMSMADAAQQGITPTIRILMRELGDLPVNLILEHVYERRKGAMALLSSGTKRDLHRIRWMARGFSLLFAVLSFSSLLFTEQITLPTIVLAILSVFMLIAWHWEKLGGRLTLIGSPFCLISVMYMTNKAETVALWLAILVGVALTLATLIVGWLFVSVSQHTAMTAEPAGQRTAQRIKRILVYMVIALVMVLLLAISIFSAPFSETNIEVNEIDGDMMPGKPAFIVPEGK